MISFNNFALYSISLIILLLVFLFFVGIGGSVSAYIKKFIGDNSAIEKGYGSINPFFHIDEFWILIFLLTKIFIRNPQPFFMNWEKGIKGFFQKIIFIFGTTLFHLVLAAIILYISVWIWGGMFLNLAIKTPLSPSINLVKIVKEFFNGYSGNVIIAVLFALYGITVNLTLALLDFFVSIIDFSIRTYVYPYTDSIKVTILSYIAIMIILIIYSDLFLYIAWRFISLPIFIIN
jgi:hypothetical protein